jgi:hypothetical protein
MKVTLGKGKVVPCFYGHLSLIIVTTAVPLNYLPNNFAYFRPSQPASPDIRFNIVSTKESKWKDPK